MTTPERWPGRWVEALMLYGPCLPLTLTDKPGRQYRWLRLFGLLWFVVWAPLLMLLVALPFLLLFAAMIVVETWHGDWS